MAYYTNFINAWNSITQPPTGVIGTALTAGMTTAEKLAAVNAWTVTGSIPTTIYTTGDQILNCINWAEFSALTADKQQNLLYMCQVQGPLLGGSGQTAHMVPGMIIAYFNVAGATVANLTALAKATSQPWWQYAGYPRAFDLGDCAAAGVT